ncbi:MAG: hypothetical protein ABFD69_08070 [Candidatus Sumerlaeia bacterium]
MMHFLNEKAINFLAARSRRWAAFESRKLPKKHKSVKLFSATESHFLKLIFTRTSFAGENTGFVRQNFAAFAFSWLGGSIS